MSNPSRTESPLVDHSAPNHRCTECTLTGALQRLEAELNLISRERTRLADENIALSARAALAEEERDIAVRRAARAVEEKEALFEQLLRLEQIAEERRESMVQADRIARQLQMVGAL